MSSAQIPKCPSRGTQSEVLFHSHSPKPVKRRLATSISFGIRPETVYLLTSNVTVGMETEKATVVEKVCSKRQIPFVKFDITDHGQSVSPELPKRWSFNQFKKDVSLVIDKLTEGPQVIFLILTLDCC